MPWEEAAGTWQALRGKTAADRSPSSRFAGVHGCFAGASLFSGLPAAAAAALFEEMSWFSLPGGSVLFRQGEQGEALYLVVSGRLVVLADQPGGEPVLVAESGVGETVGEMALISGETRSATVMALRDSELLRDHAARFRAHPRALPPRGAAARARSCHPPLAAPAP